MTNCAVCDRPVQVEPGLEYCKHCGTRLPDIPVTISTEAPEAPRLRRLGACAIDIVPMLLLFPIDILAAPAYSLLWAAYWLLRDVKGSSIGKNLLGLTVVAKSGGPSTTFERILRNVPLALTAFPLAIPGLGAIAGPFGDIVIFALEAVLILIWGRRIGDMLAGTKVVKGH